MKVSQAAARDVRVVSPDQTIRDIARTMAGSNMSATPVGKNDQLVGMITNRDIAIREVAEGTGPDAPVREVMTPDVRCCFEDEDVADVARIKSEHQPRAGRGALPDRQSSHVAATDHVHRLGAFHG